MKSLFLAGLFSLFAFASGAQVIYNSSGQPRNENRDRDREKERYFTPETKLTDRLVWGGGATLQFGQGVFLGGLSPIVGYNITDNFSAGLGLGYRHYRANDYFENYNAQTGQYELHPLTANLYTPSLWTRYIVWRNLFIHAEAEYHIQRYKYWDIDRDINSPTYATPIALHETLNAPAILIGPGLRQPISEKVSLVTMLLLEVLRDENSPYAGVGGPGGFPIDFRLGINVNFGAPVW